MYFLLVILIGIFSFISRAEDFELNYDLPTHITPTHYQLKLTLFNPVKFNGEVAINITVHERSRTIVLHLYEKIFVEYISLQQNQWQSEPKYADFDNETELLTITFLEEFNPGDYILQLKYIGICSFEGGLVFGSHILRNRTIEHYWSTHFEPTFARRVFPCFDEPQIKTTFQLELSHLNFYDAHSNTEVEKTLTGDGEMVTTIFKETPKMSTYILAFEVSKFKANILISGDRNKKYRIIAKKTLFKNTYFALKLTKTSVDYFEKLLGIDYGLPKLDSVFIPEFPGGMENWGLIVYGDEIFPTKKQNTVKGAVILICHEVAHQWFGNLVTCNSWDYLWLNEGFASYYEVKCADAIFGNNSTNRFMIQHNIFELNNIFADDSFEVSKSLNIHVIPPELVSQKFDSITYTKGAAIVRFMSTFLPNYDTLITKYLKKYSYSSVSPDDLFNSLNENRILPADVKDIMHNWVETPGYPLITLNISRNKGGIVIEVEQERFLVEKTNKNNQKWWIPITLAFESLPDFDNMIVTQWMRDTENKVTIEIKGRTNDWVIANLQAMVFCRVNYDLDNWKRIINFLKGPNFEKIHVINRARLLNDAYYLVENGKLSDTVLHDLLGYLKQETDPLINENAKDLRNIAEEMGLI